MGGLGLHDLSKWRIALMARTAFRLVARDGSLLEEVFRAKYGGRQYFFSVRNGDSWGWRLICLGGGNALCLSYWKIGTGALTRFDLDAWISDLAICRWPTFINMDSEWPSLVGDLLNPDGSWRMEILPSLCGVSLWQRILALPRKDPSSTDRLVWTLTEDNKPISSILYRHFLPACPNRGSWCWRVPLPPRISTFLWRICRGGVPTRTWLCARGIGSLETCPRGCGEDESLCHALLSCCSAREVWRMVLDQMEIAWTPISLEDALNFSEALVSKDRRSPIPGIVGFLCHSIWFARNQLVHGKKVPPARVLANSIVSSFQLFASASPPGIWGPLGQSGPSHPVPFWVPPPQAGSS